MYLLAGVCIDPGNTIASMVATSLAVMALLLALFYMAAQLFKKPEYEGFVSIEMHQLLVSLLIFLLVFGASWLACDIANGFAQTDPVTGAYLGGDQFDIARNYLNYVSNQVALPTLVSLEKTKIIMQWFGSVSMRWGLSIWGATLPGFPSFVLLERVLEFVLMLMAPFVSSLTVQQIGLEIIRGTMLPYVLPAGVVLRIFPPTREAGSFMIVTAIGFQIVFPYTYVMHRNIVEFMISQDALAAQNGTGADLCKGLAHAYPGLFTYIDDSETGPSFSLGNLYTHVMSYPCQILHSIDSLSYIILQAVFLPALSLSLTIAFIKGTLKFVSQKLD